MLIITKEFIPSFGLVSEENLDEVNFLVKQIQDINLKVFKRKSVIFEHGMCACIGGLDRAHLHIMTTHENSNSKTLKNSIDKVLFNRKAGIKHIKFGKYKLENIHDINQFFDEKELKK